jgi:hypothetical protein
MAEWRWILTRYASIVKSTCRYVTENTEFRMHTSRYSQQKLPVDSRGASISKVTSTNFHDFLIMAGNLADELQDASM